MNVLPWISRWYRRLIRLYPPSFQADFGDELAWVFDQATEEAAHQGNSGLLRLCLHELSDLPWNILNQLWRNREVNAMLEKFLIGGKRIVFYIVTLITALIFLPPIFGARIGRGWRLIALLVGWFVFTTLAWQARKLPIKVWFYTGLVVLAGLFWPTSFLIESNFVFQDRLPQPFLGILDVVIFLLPILALIIAAYLIYAAMKMIREQQNKQAVQGEVASTRAGRGGWTLTYILTLSILLLVKFYHNLSGLIMWENTYDPIEFLWLFLPILIAILCGIILLLNLPGKSKLAGLLFLLLVPAMMFIVYVPAVNIDPHQVTTERAERLSYAIENYYQREGKYPQTLSQLVPRDRLFIPVPMIINGQSWCYDAGLDYYRLGYVDRCHWSSPNFFGTVFKSVGDVSGLPAVCDAVVTAHNQQFSRDDFIGCK
jgi:hypothetical protein